MEKTLLIFNRFADKGKIKNSLEEILHCLMQAGIEAEAVITECVGHAIDLAETAVREGFQKVLVAGGDGTVNEAVNGLVKAQKNGYGSASLGVIPNGRGNDFVYAMKIPRNLQQAVAVIQADKRIKIDIGCAGDGATERYFCNGSGFGFDSAINYYATQSRLNGFPSYLLGLVKAILFDLHHVPAKVTWDEGTVEMPILLLTAMNGLREGGGFIVAPNFDITDGKLDICMVGDNLKLPRLLPLIPLIMKGQLNHPDIRTFKTRKLVVEISGPGVQSQVDGESIFTAGTRFVSEISPWKVDLITEYQPIGKA